MESTEFSTTYTYKPLAAKDHIRLLRVHTSEDGTPSFELVHRSLSSISSVYSAFEAVSYTWGSPAKVSILKILGSDGTIALTHNLSEALPYLARHTTTGYLWIDQLCINQSDGRERAHQVAMMARIYKSAQRVIVWLGVADDRTRKCKQWLTAVDVMLKELPHSHVLLADSLTFNPDIRTLIVRNSFVAENADPAYAAAIHSFWQQKWFTRGWIVQEYLLASKVLMVAGDEKFSHQDLLDMRTVPVDPAAPNGPDTENSITYSILMDLKTDPFTEKQPVRFMKLMAQASEEFVTLHLEDRLFAFLGMVDGSGFVPDYSEPPRVNFTRFAVALAKNFESLDFLSMWSANLDALLPGTPDKMKDFPSWVPSWSGIPLSCPFRMLSPSRTIRNTVRWDASKGQRYIYGQSDDAAETGRLLVHGQIIDHVDRISSAKIDKFQGVDEAYLNALLQQIKSDIPNAPFSSWSILDLVHFLNTVSYSGSPVRESADEVLGTKPIKWGNELRNNCGYNESLALCLLMGKARRFMITERGRIGLIPVMGSKQKEGNTRGSVIAILYGCSVPIVLEQTRVNGEYTIIGDCFVEGVMHGEAIEEEDVDQQTFVLI